MMAANTQFMELLWGLVIRLLVAALGIAWALVNWRKSSTAATLVSVIKPG